MEMETMEGKVPEQSSSSDEEDTYVYNDRAGILHAAVRSSPDIDKRHKLGEGREVWSTLCKCELTKSVFRVTRDIPDMAMPCRRKACLRSLEDNLNLP